MRLKSFLQYLTRGWRKIRPIRNKPAASRSTRLLVEMLEQRELLAADIPSIVAAGVLPMDGSSSATGLPLIQVQFSETMTNSALTPSNYVLLGSTGNNIAVNTVSFNNSAIGGAATNSVVQLTYNLGAPLVVDNYTLFVRGDRLFDLDDGFSISQPGQLVVANSGRNNVAVVNLPGDGTLGAVSSYNLPAVGVQAANPNAVALGDLDGDGINDLVVVNAGTNQVLIYQGQAASEGGGYSTTPDLALNLPAGAANLGKSLLLTDLNKDGKLDIVVANVNTFNITVFLNTSASAGTLSFNSGSNFATDANPVGIVAGDFDGDTNIDLAVAISTAPTDLGAPSSASLDYRVNILPGDGAGNFGAISRFRVGDVAPLDLQAPTSIAAGLFNLDAKLDLAVGGTNGIAILVNNSTPGNFNFALQPGLLGASSIVSLAVGNLDAGNNSDIVAATTVNTVEVYRNTGRNAPVTFLPVTSIAVAAGSTGRIALGDLNSDGKSDIVLSNGAAAGNLTVLKNTTVGGSISAATNASPIVVTSVHNGLQTGQRVVISGALGNTAANNTGPNPTWTVTVVTGAVVSASGTGSGSPISINSVGHGLVTGESVTITGNSYAPANGTFTVTFVDADNFTLNGTNGLSVGNLGNGGTWTSNDRFALNGSTGNNPYTGGATWVLAGSVTGNIANVTGNLVSPIVITSHSHGLVSGEQVTVAGVTGNTVANNTWTITSIDADHFSLNSSIGGPANYTGGGSWTLAANITAATGNAVSPIVITSANHGLVSGQRVIIAGVTGNTNANNTWTITVPGSVSISVSTTVGNPISVNSSGHGLTTGNRVTITGSALPAANGTFTVTVTDTNNFTLNGTSANSVSGPLAGGAWTSPDKFSLNGSTGGPANYINGGLWSLTGAISNTTGLATNPIVVSSNGHGLTTGNIVTIAGASDPNANGTFTVTVINANTFSLNNTIGANPAGAGGNWTRSYAATSVSNTSPILITSNSHGLTTGAAVTVAGVTGNTNANGTWTITVLDQDHFFLNGTTGNGAYLGGGTWTTTTSFFSPVASVTAVGVGGVNPIAITTTSAHGLANGNQVTFAGMAGTLASALNGNTFTITVTDSTHFTLNNTSAIGTASGGMYVTGAGVAGPVTSPYTTDATPLGVAIGDTNQDGFADVVVANNTGNDFTTLLGNGQGLLQIGTDISVTPTVTSGVAVGDFNGDGITDLAVINNNGANNSTFVSILQGQVGGTYAAPVNISPVVAGRNMRNLVSITIADVNGDGHPDIVVADSQDNSVGFLRNLNTTAGTQITAASFSAVQDVGVGQTPTQVVMGDFNHDGKLDLAVSHNRQGGGGGNRRGVTIRLGNGDFTFQNSFEIDGGGGGTPMSSLVLGDFNKDGNLDFIAAEDNAPGNIHVHYGDGKGGFGTNGTFATSVPNPGAIKAADFNGDGFLDVIVSSKSTALTNAGVAVLLNQLGTGFGTALQTDVVPGTGMQDVLTTDVNQDGFADAIVTTTLPRLSGVISSASNSGGAFQVTSNGHGLSNGNQVQISGSNLAGMNGIWTISNVTATTFKLVGSTFANGYTANSATWARINSGFTTDENVFVLIGKGNGSFQSPVPYLASDVSSPPPAPSYLGITASPLVRVTTFSSGGAIVNVNLINNGDFESRDLNNEQGNLLGWQTFNLNTSPGGSLGNWLPQTGTTSPLSGTTVPTPTAKFRAMLDENNSQPYSGNNNPNSAASYQGSHTLYQDIAIPAGTTKAILALNLYIDNTDAGGYSDTSTNTTLDFRTSSGGSVLANQQVRVDIMRPGASNPLSVSTIPQATGNVATATETGGVGPIVIATTAANGLTTGTLVTISGVPSFAAANGTFTITVVDATHFSLNGTSTAGSAAGGAWSVPGDVLRNEFITTPTTALTYNSLVQDLDLTAFAGQTIRLRIASANNQGRLIIGVDNVKLFAQFADTAGPTLTGLNISNPAFVSGGIPHTNDPTLVGKIADNSGLSAIAYVEFDPNNNGFGGPDDLKITAWDAQGNFRFTLPNTPAGFNTIGVQVVDKAGNATKTTFTFFMQSNSVTEWEAVGPQGIDVTGQNVDYTKVSGRITVTVPDLNDPLGNSYFVGSVNGGIWKSTDGGSTWVSVTNSVTDGSGNPIPVPIGGMAQSKTNPSILYAATGVGDRELDSRPGVGVLKSIDGGKTWTLIGNSGTVLAGARAVKVVVDNNNPNIAYVGVASNSTGTTGGVYKTTDGGLTWVNVLDPASMRYLTNPTNLGSLTTLGAAGAPVDSVTDLITDPADSHHIIVALGSVGLVPSRGVTGVWQSSNDGAGWTLVEGGDNAAIANNGLPNEKVAGNKLGRVTLGIGQGRIAAQTYLYVLIGTIPGNNTPPNVDFGTFSGLYRSKDVGLNFTKVMLKQDTGGGGVHNFVNINLLSHDAANAGAMLVDPSDPNVVYVGGSGRWSQAGDPPNHVLIRIDTGNMVDTSGANTGDDASKANRAAGQGGVYDPAPGPGTDLYKGEGVYWYDMLENQSGKNGKLTSLPDAITSLSLDVQGRLLVGTIGGVWRGVPYGFGYDFTSGNNGILRQGGGNQFSAPGMNFTSINGNLQIADMTSVAIDPFNRGVFYTTQIDTGVAGSSAPLVWVSQGLTGPTVNGNNLGIPNAGAVLTGNPAPGSPSGTPVSLFRIWQYANQLALQPETSNDNGGSWSSINSAGISVNSSAGVFPAFAIDPTPILQSGLYQTELAFGANVVYTTDTSGTAWFASSGILSAGANISALTFAASDVNAQTLYAATDNGRLFHTVNKGGDGWPEIDTSALGAPYVNLPIGIAGTYIKGIAVDAANANELFVMYGGTGTTDHVYHSTDGGQNWLSVSGVASGLPSVPAYAMVIDRTRGLGAAKGKLYLATEVGVYYSINNGATWAKLGQGMPNVPVVDLKFDGTRASGTIASASGPGLGNPIVIATNGSHGLSDATQVAITGVTGFPAANGNFTITVVDATHFSLNGTSAAGSGTGGAWTVPGLQILAAATLGRGVYTINTSGFSFIADQTIDEDTTSHAIPFTVNDPTNFGYSISTSSDNQFLIPDGSIVLGGSGQNRTIQFTPVANANTPTNGVAHITVAITSGAFNYQQTFQVTVNPVNDLPTISAIPTQVTPKRVLASDPGTPVINFTIGDVETPATALTVTASSNNTTLVPNLAANLTLGGSGPNRTLVITPALNQVGSADITITVTDANFGITKLTFSLQVTGAVVLPFSDDFNRADNAIFLGPTWTQNVGTFSLKNSMASAATGLDIVSLNQLSAADITLQTDVNVPTGKNLGLVARYNGGVNNMYLGAIVNNLGSIGVTADIWKNVAGVWTQLASTPVNSIAGFITGATNAGPIVITSVGHGLLTGDKVAIAGVNGNTAANNAGANPVWVITVLDADHFSLNGSTGNAAYTSGGAWSRTVTVRFDVADDSLKLYVGRTAATLALAAFANDRSLTGPGTAGLRSSTGNVTADNFSAAAINLFTPALPFADTFNQTAGTQLSDNWVNRQNGNFADNGTAMVASPSIFASVATIYNQNQTSGFAQAEVNVVSGGYSGVVARYSTNGFYYAVIVNTGSGFVADIYRFLSNPATGVPYAVAQLSLGTTGGAQPVGFGNGTIRLEVIGSSLKVFYGPVGTFPTSLVNYAYDPYLTVGAAGIRASTGRVIDNFTTGNITLKNPTSLPFLDDFSTAVNANQLFGNAAQLTPPNERNWQDQAGDFIVSGGKATSNPSVSFATIAGALGDSSAQADVVVDPAVNQNAGVVVRASAAGAYYGEILSTGSGFVAKILKLDANGNVSAQLNANTIPVLGSGTIRLEAAGPALKLFFNGNLAAYGSDPQFTVGQAGMRATRGNTTSIDNFTANAIVLTAPAVPPPAFVDTFDAPNNGNQLSLNWTERQGNFSVAGSHLVGNDPVMNIATLNGVSFADESAQVDIVSGTANQNTSLVLRYQAASGAYYVAGIVKSGSTYVSYILGYDGTNFYNLASIAAVPAVLGSTGTLRFEIAGNMLKLFWNGALAAYGYDFSLPTAGLAGIRVSSGVVLDNFAVDRVLVTTPTLPFNDNFNTAANGNQLYGDTTQLTMPEQRNWDERAGDFVVSGGVLTANDAATPSLATVHGQVVQDAAVQALVTVGAYQYAELIARYQSVQGNDYYYMAILQANANGTASTAYIYRNVAGAITLIGNGLPINAVSGTLRFEVVGSDLKLFFNGALAVYAYDAVLPAAGLTGVRASKGAQFDNFFADAITLLTPTAGAHAFADNFSVAANTNQLYGDATQLTGNDQRHWEERLGNFTINGTQQAVGNDPILSIATVHGLSLADATVQADVILGASQYAGVVARYQAASGVFYTALIQSNAAANSVTPYIFSANGNYTQIAIGAAVAITAGSAQTIRFEVAGTSLKLFMNGGLVAFGNDTTIAAAGLTGIRAFKNAILDNFQVDPIVLINPTLPFADLFNEPANTSLSRNWTERQGLFKFTGTALQAIAPNAPQGVSIATVNTPVLDSSVQEDINLPATGTHIAGLVSRFDAATGNMYLGVLASFDGSTSAYLFIRYGGTFYALNNPVSVSATGAGTVRLEVVGTSIKLFYTPSGGSTSLVGYANEPTLTVAGTSGVYLGNGDTATNFNLSAVNLNTPALPFNDPFTGIDGTQLSLNWQQQAGNFGVVGNKLVANAANNLATVNGLTLPAVQADVDISVTGTQHAGVVVRYQANGGFYTGLVGSNGNNTFTAYIFRFAAGGANPVQLAAVTVNSGVGTLSLEAVGPDLKLFYGATLATQSLIAYAYDTNYTTGTTGIRSNQGATFDNFRTSAVNVPLTQPATFTETFAANPPTQQLSTNWTERAGNFTVQGGPASSAANAVTAVNGGANIAGLNGISIATVNGISAADVDLSALVNLSAAGQFASVIARYTGNPGADTYYIAAVTFVGVSNYKVEIDKVVSGVKTVLGFTSVASFTSGLRFLVVNGNLNVYLDGNAIAALTLVDNSITGPGAVGIRANTGAKVTKFTAS